MSETTPSSPRPRNAELTTLSASFAVFRDCLPLAVGIHKAIRERMPEINRNQLRVALQLHTASTRYLKALSQGQTRFDLDGAVAGEITAEQRQQALDTLRERFRKGAERRKAELQQQEHQEKLLKLAEKFNAR
ncbi:MAG: ProQ/FinO family protein [Proteobacteria bacterium]|nr:ProQ/FinO family protein [Pseudomonadota bacterium]